jgi:hypothetical protein
MEAMTGAAFMITEHSEHEECRKCLDPGLKRRCCGNYYCDTCYYQEAACRSCDTEIGGNALDGKKKGKGMNTTIILGWLVTVFLVLIIAASGGIMAASEAQTPMGVFGNQCLGFFRTCDVPLCIQMNHSVAMGVDALSPLYDWRYCKLDTTEYSIQGYGCVFDEQLYRTTGRTGGYPYANTQQSSRHFEENEGAAPMPGRALGFEMCLDTFNEGAYVFEDQFESWEQVLDVPSGYTVGKNYLLNTQASALWDRVENGWTSDFCGLAKVPGNMQNSRALTFKGEGSRFAETKDMDTSGGGWLQADMYMAPMANANRPDREFCQPNGQGTVNVEFKNSLVNDTWTLLQGGKFEPWRVRDDDFFKISLKFKSPLVLHPITRFRFNQIAEMDETQDAWAIDNVRIFRYFAKDWHSSEGFLANQQISQDKMMQAACCYDTERCEKRMTAEEKEACWDYDIPGYQGPKYELRTVELLLLGVIILTMVKFTYICVQDWYARKRFPFQDEYEFLTKVDYLMQLVPVEYRPSKPFMNMVSNVHMSARMMAAQAQELLDEEEAEDLDELARIEAEKAEKKLRRKEKRKRKLRLGYSKELASVDSSDDEDDNSKLEKGAVKESAETTDLDKLKRSNVAQLRLPFSPNVNINYRYFVMSWTIGIFMVMSSIMAGVVPSYEISQGIKAWGVLETTISMHSTTITFFAWVADFKEIFHTLKHIVPVHDSFIPMVTLDLSQEGSALYIGRHVVRLKDVTEANTFPYTFAYVLTAGVLLGNFPWCILMLLMRELYLPLEVTRILIPSLGVVVMTRVVLGPAVFVKVGFALYYLFDFNPKTRENIGMSFQTRRTKFSTLMGFLGVTLGGMFFVGTFMAQVALPAFLGFMVIGVLYGGVAGCTHGLPIRPWLIMTCAQEGTWLRVKKKERCPCIYWGNWCTDIHEMEEVLVLYPEESVRFFSAIKGGTRG